MLFFADLPSEICHVILVCVDVFCPFRALCLILILLIVQNSWGSQECFRKYVHPERAGGKGRLDLIGCRLVFKKFLLWHLQPKVLFNLRDGSLKNLAWDDWFVAATFAITFGRCSSCYPAYDCSYLPSGEAPGITKPTSYHYGLPHCSVYQTYTFATEVPFEENKIGYSVTELTLF